MSVILCLAIQTNCGSFNEGGGGRRLGNGHWGFCSARAKCVFDTTAETGFHSSPARTNKGHKAIHKIVTLIVGLWSSSYM